MERIITIIALVVCVAAFGYLKMEQMERRAADEAAAVEAAELAQVEAAEAAIEASIVRFTVPHDSDAGTNDVQIYMNGISSGDMDSDSLAFTWEQLDGTTVSLENTDGVMTSFTAAQGEYTFRLTVTDTYGDQASQEATVAVSPEPNHAPEVQIEVYTEN